MITAQDIREKTFDKATFGGYDMSQVDDFLEEMAADVAAAQKETGVLKSKMKVLVNKIEEYRSTEDAMHKALVSAQRIADEIEAEAQAKADAIVSEAQAKADAVLNEALAKADAITGDLKAQREQEENRLAAAKEASGSYIEKMLLLCQKQSEALNAIRTMDMPNGAVVTPAPEEKKAIAEAAEPEAEPESAEEEPEYVRDFERAVLNETEPEAEPAPEEEVDEPTRMFRF